MKGSVTKYTVKGSSRPRWRFRICVGKDDQGRYLYEGLGGFAKEGDCVNSMRAYVDAFKARSQAPAVPPPPPEILFGEWLDKWLDDYAIHTCQPKTMERYRQLAAYITSATEGEIATLARLPLSAVARKDIKQALFAVLRLKGKRREHISPRTVRHIAGVLSSALSQAVELEMLPANPMLRLKGLPSSEPTDVRSLSPDEIRAVRDTCRGDWTFAFVEVALASGSRRGELLALQWPDIDWAAKTLSVTKSLEQTASGLRVKSTKSKKPRRFQLSQGSIAALQFLRDQQQENRRLFGGDYQDNALIFAEPNGDYLQPDLVSQTIVRRLRKAGIGNASLHSLRHSNATNLLSKGVPLAAVSARLGHADPSITHRIYNHALPADDRRAADKWDEIIGPVQ
jgi:integrase